MNDTQLSSWCASQPQQQPDDDSRIRPIPEETIKLIAAGEVIQKPVNVVKELIENCLDAQSSKVLIWIRDKCKSIKIQDNGKGINKDDLPILCHRHTSSKLSQIEDLNRLQTYGFRGEALSSMSMVARVSISTRHRLADFGYEATYNQCELESVREIAANKGTTVTISDLFYNIRERQQDLELNHRADYSKIVDVVRKYAIHCSNVQFFLESDQSRIPDIETDDTHRKPSSASTQSSQEQAHNQAQLARIKQFYTKKVAEKLVYVQHSDDRYNFSVNGFASNTNSVLNKFVFILFINGRLVDCEELKRKLQNLYSDMLMKNYAPFIYLNLKIASNDIDVNLHPSKREVRYLNEDVINEKIRQLIEDKLKEDSEQREMQLSFSGGMRTSSLNTSAHNSSVNDTSSQLVHHLNSSSVGPNTQVISLDSRQYADLDEQPNKHSSASSNANQKQGNMKIDLILKRNTPNISHQAALSASKPSSLKKLNPSQMVRTDPRQQKITQALRRGGGQNERKRLPDGTKVIRLCSIENLLNMVNKYCDHNLTTMFRQSTYVGLVDTQLLLLQYGTELVGFRYPTLCKQLFYQIYLRRFGEFDKFKFKEPLCIRTLINLHEKKVESEADLCSNVEANAASRQANENFLNVLMGWREMFSDYFGIEISNKGEIVTIPILIAGHQPNFELLPFFVCNLKQLDFSSEESCFYTFGQILADYYSLPTSSLDDMRTIAEFYVYPKLKQEYRPSDVIYSVRVTLADCNALYKVFERC